MYYPEYEECDEIADCDPYGSLTSACEQLASACEELSGRYEEECNPIYMPVEKMCYWGVLNFYGEYLWWKVHQEGLHFAVTGVLNNTVEGKLFALNGEWSSGFRVGAGIFFPINTWRINLDWLQMHTSEERGVVNPGGALPLRTTRLIGDTDTITSAIADWRFKLDSIRLTLEVPLFMRTHVSIIPSIGVRNDYIRETFRADYSGAEPGFYETRTQYNGLGPEIAVNASWYLLPCFSIFGNLRTSGMYGSLETHQIVFDTDTNEDVAFRYDFDRLQTTLGSTVGVQWEGSFFRNIFLRLSLGWETNIWFNFNTLYQTISTVSEGTLVNISDNLSTSGVTFRGTLSF